MPIETKQPVSERRAWWNEQITFALVYAILSFINLRVKLWVTPHWFDGKLERVHDRLVQFTYVNNEQSRVLQFWIPEAIHRTFGLSIPDAYTVQRWLFVFLSFVIFHAYLRRWFDTKGAFAGVVLLSAIMPLGYFGDIQESSPLMNLTFLVSLLAIRDNTIWLLLCALVIGGLNNETMLVVPGIYFLVNLSDWRIRPLASQVVKTIAVSLPVVCTVGLLRAITWNYPRLAPFYQLTNNLNGIRAQLSTPPWRYHEAQFLYPAFLFGAFWVYAFLDYRHKPPFLRRAALILPFYFAGPLVGGMVNEVRLFMPLAFIIIPMGLFSLLGGTVSSGDQTASARALSGHGDATGA